MGTGISLLPPAADQVSAAGREPRVGGLLRLLPEQSEIKIWERTPGDRRARRGRRRGEEPERVAAQQEQSVRRFGWPAHRAGAPEQRGGSEIGVLARLALRSVPARAGGVFLAGVLRRGRRGVCSVYGQRNDDGRGGVAR